MSKGMVGEVAALNCTEYVTPWEISKHPVRNSTLEMHMQKAFRHQGEEQ